MGIRLKSAWVLAVVSVLSSGGTEVGAADLTLSAKTAGDWAIRLPANATVLEQRAADVLRTGLHALTGIELAVRSSAPTPPTRRILIQRGGDPQGFAVRASDTGIDLSGNPLAAASALLDHLGLNRVSLYQMQDWGLSVRRPKDRVLRVAEDLELTSAKGVPARAFVLTRPGMLPEPFLDWMVGHGLNRVIIRATADKAERDALVTAAAARGLVVEYGGPGAFVRGSDDDAVQAIRALLAERPEIAVVDCWPTSGHKDVAAYLGRLRTLAGSLPKGKVLAGLVQANWPVPGGEKPLPDNVFLWIGVKAGQAKTSEPWVTMAASPRHAGLLAPWLGSDKTLFAAPSADPKPMAADLAFALEAHLGGVACECGPGRWFWDIYSDVANMFARAAVYGTTDVAALRRRFCEVSYGSTADAGLEFLSALDRLRRLVVIGRLRAELFSGTAGEPARVLDLWREAQRTADRARRASPRDSAQRKRWVWRLAGLRYYAAQLEASRRLHAAKAFPERDKREAALRAALTDLLAYNQAKVGHVVENEGYGLTEAGRPVGLEREVPLVADLRDALLETAGAKPAKNLASGAKAAVSVGQGTGTPTASLTDGHLRTAAAFPADPLVRVTVDLGAERTVTRVRFLSAPANIVTAFRIQVGSPGGALSTIAQGRVGRSGWFDWQSVTFAPQRARTVVLRVDGFASLSPGGGGGLTEIEVE